MKLTRWILAALVAGGVIWLLTWILRSDETRIRELLAGMAADFNRGSVLGTISGLDERFQETTARVGREEVQQLLLALSLSERDPETREFNFQVTLDPVTIQVAPDHTTAAIQLEAAFSDRRPARKAQGLRRWRVSIDGKLEKKEGAWKVVTSSHTALEGKLPF